MIEVTASDISRIRVYLFPWYVGIILGLLLPGSPLGSYLFVSYWSIRWGRHLGNAINNRLATR